MLIKQWLKPNEGKLTPYREENCDEDDIVLDEARTREVSIETTLIWPSHSLRLLDLKEGNDIRARVQVSDCVESVEKYCAQDVCLTHLLSRHFPLRKARERLRRTDRRTARGIRLSSLFCGDDHLPRGYPRVPMRRGWRGACWAFHS